MKTHLTQLTGIQLAEYLETNASPVCHAGAAEIRRLQHNAQVLMNALWKACADDEQVVNDTIESQGELL